tara:strand:- start:21 stop:215 length:195 start_codon:yes stop_codon:yes gene_type:complete
MTTYELLMLFVGFAAGTVISYIIYYKPLRILKWQVKKLKGQVYYWSRQMPVIKKRGRPKKVKSV